MISAKSGLGDIWKDESIWLTNIPDFTQKARASVNGYQMVAYGILVIFFLKRILIISMPELKLTLQGPHFSFITNLKSAAYD